MAHVPASPTPRAAAIAGAATEPVVVLFVKSVKIWILLFSQINLAIFSLCLYLPKKFVQNIMQHRRFENKLIIRLDPGEEIVQSIKEISIKEGLDLGTVSGIGAVNKATIGLFDVGKKEYFSREFTGDHEIVALNGNISTMNGEVYIHLHIIISDISYQAFAGHLNEAWISATGEIFIDIINGKTDRRKDDHLGLNLLEF